MPRANLATLLDESLTPVPATSPEPAPHPDPVFPRLQEELPAAVEPALSPASTVEAVPLTGSATQVAGPRYLQLERKELRLRADQADDLARLTRRLNRARRGGGERITDNTLIRVAVDLLLQHVRQLAGTTERELRDSVSRGLPDLETGSSWPADTTSGWAGKDRG